jgi:hypothetical protein
MIMSIIAVVFFVVPIALIGMTIYLNTTQNELEDEPFGSIDIDERFVRRKNDEL